MRPRGFNAATRSAARSWRTIWQKTFCSRTRRAMSWPYCAPKSRTRTSSCSRVCIVAYRCFLVREPCEQFVQRGFVTHFTVTNETLNVHITVLEEFDLPALPGHVNPYHDRIVPTVPEGVSDFCSLKAPQEVQ